MLFASSAKINIIYIYIYINIFTYGNMANVKIEQKGMTFDHDIGYSFPNFSSLLKKQREEEKENELAKSVIKTHAFQLDHWNV